MRFDTRARPIFGLLLLTIKAGYGCGGDSRTQSVGAADDVPEAATVSSADFAQFRWLEGDWRGHGVDQPPFYERYRFVDDSTFLVDSFADSTRGRVTGTGRVELRGGQLVNRGEGMSWVAIAIDSVHAQFAPLEGASNSFVWRRGDSPAAWTATILWTDDTGARRERVYQMDRIQ